MELEQNIELRHVYMLSLPQLITNIGCAKWCGALIRILAEYCEHHTDLRTLKATLEVQFKNMILRHIIRSKWILISVCFYLDGKDVPLNVSSASSCALCSTLHRILEVAF